MTFGVSYCSAPNGRSQKQLYLSPPWKRNNKIAIAPRSCSRNEQHSVRNRWWGMIRSFQALCQRVWGLKKFPEIRFEEGELFGGVRKKKFCLAFFWLKDEVKLSRGWTVFREKRDLARDKKIAKTPKGLASYLSSAFTLHNFENLEQASSELIDFDCSGESFS